MNRTRILVADDHKLVAEGLCKLLQVDFDCVAMVWEGSEVIGAVAKFNPEIVLLDISMPPVSGLEIAKELTATFPPVKVLFVTMRAGPEYVIEAFRAGGAGYVLKSCASSDLVAAIRTVARGEKYVSPGLQLPGSQPRGGHPRGLTHRQRQVLQLIAEGTSGKEIAGTLGISPKTVEFHRLAMIRSLGARTTAELIRYAVENGVVGSTTAGNGKPTRASNAAP